MKSAFSTFSILALLALTAGTTTLVQAQDIEPQFITQNETSQRPVLQLKDASHPYTKTVLESVLPLKPRQLLFNDDPDETLKVWKFTSVDGKASQKLTAVQGMPFKKAIQVDTPKGEFYWSAHLTCAIDKPLRRGDMVYVTFWSRNLVGGDFGDATLEFKNPAGSIIQGAWGLGTNDQWTQQHTWVRADADYEPGQMSLMLSVSQKRQILEVGGFAFVNLGPGIDKAQLPAKKINLDYAGRDANAAWRKTALERIEKIRKNDLHIVVTDAAGQAIPGAKVEVEMKRHAFIFGTSAPLGMIPGSQVKAYNDDFLRTAGAPEADKIKLRETISRLFNATGGIPVWAYYKGTDARYNGADLLAEAHYYNREKGLKMLGGMLVYPRPEFLPASVTPLLKPEKSAELSQAIHDWIFEITNVYAPFQPEYINVTNEWDSAGAFKQALGGDPLDHVAQWFKWAKEAAPHTRLVWNEPDGDDVFFDNIKGVLERGGPVEGLGFQWHAGIGSPGPEARLKTLDRFYNAFQLPILISEFEVTISDPKSAQQRQFQADYLRDFFIANFSHPAVNGIVLQDFWQPAAWQYEGGSAFFNKDWTINPHGKVYEDLVLNQWMTRAQGKTNAKGAYAVRGFKGDYELTVTAGDKTQSAKVTLGEGKEAFHIQLN